MLAKRIIPSLLARGHLLVKGRQFQSWRSVGVAQQAMRVFANRSVDELLYLDIGATPEGRGPDFRMIERMTGSFFTPISVGGGISSVSDVRELLNAGADKVVMGTAALDLEIVASCSEKYGSQAISVSLDYIDDELWTHCGKVKAGKDVVEWARQLEYNGAGEIILSSIGRDGMMSGYDLVTIKAVSNAVSIPVVASGGCSGYADMFDAIKAGASAVAAGALFQFTEATPKEAAAYLNDRGITCRM